MLSSAVAIVFFLAILLWDFVTDESFHWESISPIDEPGLMPRLFYSALVFVTLGALLYSVGFYKWLYGLYRGSRRGWRDYNNMKRAIWAILMLFMFFVIVPMVVNMLNATISFFYNVLALMLYLLPPLGMTLIIYAIYYLTRKHVVGKGEPPILHL